MRLLKIHGSWLPRCCWSLCRSGPHAARSQEWTRFRGPNGTGVSDAKSIPVTWTDADYRWKTKLPGKGHGSPVVWGDKLFVLSADPNNATRYVICVHTGPGRCCGSANMLRPHIRSAASTAMPPARRPWTRNACTWPGPRGERLTLRALDHDGHEVWQQDLGRTSANTGSATRRSCTRIW